MSELPVNVKKLMPTPHEQNPRTDRQKKNITLARASQLYMVGR